VGEFSNIAKNSSFFCIFMDFLIMGREIVRFRGMVSQKA